MVLKKFISAIVVFSLMLPGFVFPAGSISQAKLGKGIVDGEIAGEASTFGLNEKAYLWVRVLDGRGETITVTWSKGEKSWDVPLEIGANTWRTWSSKILHIAGEWTVTVTDSSGATLHQSTLTVQ